jgi:MinD-like ATPase involved in chromosome partitioning or flagellar assembly
MAKIIAVHSFRRGAGKTNLTANLAAALAVQGLRVCVIDTDFRLPGLHLLFQFSENQVVQSLNQVLWEDIPLESAITDVSTRLPPHASGKLFLLPASTSMSEITNSLRRSVDIDYAGSILNQLFRDYQLDAIFLDMSAGLSEDSMVWMALSDILLILMRTNPQDYQGSAVSLDISRLLEIPKVCLVVNMVPEDYDPKAVQQEVENVFRAQVGAILPQSEDLLALSSSDLFVTRNPEHPLSIAITKLARLVVSK